MDMYVVTSAYFNFQEDVVLEHGQWNMSVFFTGGVIDIQVDGALTGSYLLVPTGGPVWFNIELECDYSTGTMGSICKWKLSRNICKWTQLLHVIFMPTQVMIIILIT